MSAEIHPAHLLKQVLVEYLSAFIPPGSDESAYPLFVETDVVEEEDQSGKISSSRPGILVSETGQSEEITEGVGVWKINLEAMLAVPGDLDTAQFEAMEQGLWQYLAGQYAGDSSAGGDTPGPLAGRLNATSRRLTDERPDEFPRLLCVGDVWQLRRAPPSLDSAALRVITITLTAIAEIMPQDFTPTA